MYNEGMLRDLLHLYDLRLEVEHKCLYKMETELADVCAIVLDDFTRMFGDSDVMADSPGDVLVAEDEAPEESYAINLHGEKDSQGEILVGQA